MKETHFIITLRLFCTLIYKELIESGENGVRAGEQIDGKRSVNDHISVGEGRKHIMGMVGGGLNKEGG